MREIGGYIEFEHYHGKEYHEHAISLNSGRHCFEYLVRAKNIQKVYMPYFMCDSLSLLCEKIGLDFEYYHIKPNFLPDFEKRLGEHEWLYLVNFYGQLNDDVIASLKKKYERLILDQAQAFFHKPKGNIDTIYTCRKFFGVPDGGYLYTDTPLPYELPVDVSHDRMEHILGRFEKTASEFFAKSVSNNDHFENKSLKRMSVLTQNLLRGINYEWVRSRRTENYTFLHNRLQGINKLRVSVPEGAFMYPLLVDNGREIKRSLAKKGIYIPTLLPNVLELQEAYAFEKEYASDILPLPVDQRYDFSDMEYLVNALEAYF